MARQPLSLNDLHENMALTSGGHHFLLTRQIYQSGGAQIWHANEIQQHATRHPPRKASLIILDPRIHQGLQRSPIEELIARQENWNITQLARVRSLWLDPAGWHFAVMEDLEGTSLHVMASRHHFQDVLSHALMRNAASTLQQLHRRNINHLTLSPFSLLITRDYQLKLLNTHFEFHLYQALKAHENHWSFEPYLAPEMLEEPPRPSAAADTYALGCICYELLTGSPLFNSTERFALPQTDEIQENQWHALNHLLALSPEDRPTGNLLPLIDEIFTPREVEKPASADKGKTPYSQEDQATDDQLLDELANNEENDQHVESAPEKTVTEAHRQAPEQPANHSSTKSDLHLTSTTEPKQRSVPTFLQRVKHWLSPKHLLQLVIVFMLGMAATYFIASESSHQETMDQLTDEITRLTSSSDPNDQYRARQLYEEFLQRSQEKSGPNRLDDNITAFYLKMKNPELQTPKTSVVPPPLPNMPQLKRGDSFTDRLAIGERGPLMVVIPAGGKNLGNVDRQGGGDEAPSHYESFDQAFALSRFEVTFDEYDLFARVTQRSLPQDDGWGRGRRPVINVSWQDANAYAKWLSVQTGFRYRLPNENEWEFAARANTSTAYWWGDRVAANKANCAVCESEWGNLRTAPVGAFSDNGFGLYDTNGNVAEWVAQCAESDQAATSCSRYWTLGGDWRSSAAGIRTSAREALLDSTRKSTTGFRVLRELP
ncbi:SUMF1/EgtB/PvdO family nonheme iron enzyme [Pokkaliibacter sp. CJK22405]|uniref:SUMF1/EgtB/PvdO family nonheme iron enzyme n=1 Tax=Pokkaliibacter sp. CJK22405 TaxID=3384615 RepID=UPI0039846C0F